MDVFTFRHVDQRVGILSVMTGGKNLQRSPKELETDMTKNEHTQLLNFVILKKTNIWHCFDFVVERSSGARNYELNSFREHTRN